MKKVNILIPALLAASSVFAQNAAIDQLFQKYDGKEGFTSVNVSEKLFDLAASAMGNEDPELTAMVGELKGIKILTYENREGSLQSREYYNEAEKALNLSSYEELFDVKSDGDKVRLLAKPFTGNVIDELILLVDSDDEFVLIDINGKIDFDKISKLSNMKLDKMDELKKVEEKEENK